MSLNFNRRGELQENTIITDDGVAFIEERKYSPHEMEDIRAAEKVLDELEEFYGTLNPFELMDEHIRKSEMIDYISARYVLHKLGWTSEEDL